MSPPGPMAVALPALSDWPAIQRRCCGVGARPHNVGTVTSGQRRLLQWSCMTTVVLAVAALFLVVHQEDRPLSVRGQTVGDFAARLSPTTPTTSTTTTAKPAVGPVTTTSTTDSPQKSTIPTAPSKAKSSKITTLPDSVLFPASTTTPTTPSSATATTQPAATTTTAPISPQTTTTTAPSTTTSEPPTTEPSTTTTTLLLGL
jgi:hypothetical protein